MNRRLGLYGLVLAPFLASCSPQTVREQDPTPIGQTPPQPPLPAEYERANGRYHASQFLTIEEVISVRDELSRAMACLNPANQRQSPHLQQAQERLRGLDARIQNHESYQVLKPRIVAWLRSDPQRLESLAIAENERGGYLCLENGQIRFQEVQRDDTAAIGIREDIRSLSAKVQAQTATPEEYESLRRGLRAAEELMIFRVNQEAQSEPELAGKVVRGLGRMADYLAGCYDGFFSRENDLIPADFAATEAEFLRLYTLMIIRSGINIPPPDKSEKVTLHTHPDFGPTHGIQGPSGTDLNLSRGLVVRNPHTGDTRPAMAGFVVAFGAKKVSVYGYDFGSAELLGEFTRD